jgi:hypothetical protein
MGISMSMIYAMEDYDLLGRTCKILDFRMSNLYTATSDEVTAFLKRHNPKPRSDLDVWATLLAAGSQPDASGQALNRAFVGELFVGALG